MRAASQLVALALGLSSALLGSPAVAAPAKYEDPWAPATEAAAEAAVAKLGAKRARAVSGTVRTVAGLTLGTGSTGRAIKATVLDLEAAKRDLAATENELEVRIELPADVLFDVDKAEIRADAAQALAHLGTVIRSYSGPVRLLGHTDSDGSDAHNLDLSQRRAESVKAWLVAKESIPAARLATEGYGETRPAAANDTAENKQKNRRVEVIVRKA